MHILIAVENRQHSGLVVRVIERALTTNEKSECTEENEMEEGGRKDRGREGGREGGKTEEGEKSRDKGGRKNEGVGGVDAWESTGNTA